MLSKQNQKPEQNESDTPDSMSNDNLVGLFGVLLAVQKRIDQRGDAVNNDL